MRACACLLGLLLAACAPRALIYQTLGKPPPALRDFGEGFVPPISVHTGLPVAGFGGNGGGVKHVPVIFVHGNSQDAAYWLPARAAFKAAGYTDDELWALTYGWESTRALDNATLSAVTLERFVAAVEEYLYQKTGQHVRRFDVVGHSLGVTLSRYWLQQSNRYASVRAFVGIAGANHGVWTSTADARGQNRTVAFELNTGGPWLERLNAPGETPGPTRYFTLYDGTGRADVFFPRHWRDSSVLEGATNLAINHERGSFFGHLELGQAKAPLAQVIEWLATLPEPQADAEPPEILRAGGALTTSQPEAKLYCSNGAQEPRLQGKGNWRTVLEAGAATPTSCFAWNEKTQLASPLQRYWAGADAADGQYAAITLTATPEPGAYANPQTVKLESSEPGAMIVYSSTVALRDSGAPRYTGPIYVPGPLTVNAQAIAPDGRRSPPVSFAYDISIAKVDAQFAWDRQLDADAEEHLPPAKAAP